MLDDDEAGRSDLFEGLRQFFCLFGVTLRSDPRGGLRIRRADLKFGHYLRMYRAARRCWAEAQRLQGEYEEID
jgi:hypothetical protein